MHENSLPKIIKNEFICYQTKAQSVQEVAETVSDPTKIKTVKIVHSGTPNNPCLKSIASISKFSKVQSVILKENAITQIKQIGSLAFLRELDITSNYITSLKGIEKCLNLEKIVAHKNCISTFDGLNEVSDNNKIVYLDLSKNKLNQVGKVKCLCRLTHLKEVYFEKKNSSNPLCSDREKYYRQLNDLICQCQELQKIDGKTIPEMVKLISSMKTPQISRSPQHLGNSQQNNMSALNFYNASSEAVQVETQFKRHVTKKSNYPKKNYEFEEVLKMKDEMIEELKAKIYQLQMNSSQQYKELLKKQTENERIYGQLTELSKQLDQKDAKLNQSHRRVESLLSSCAEINKSVQLKNEQIEKHRKEISQLKIQNAQYRALSKDYEKRMSQLHHKALSNVEERTVRTEELKRQNKQLYDQNIAMVNDISSLKERVRELTELLRQWDYKYESKVNQLHKFHQNEKENIMNEAQARIEENNQAFEKEIEKMDEEMKKQINSMEAQYKSALDETLSKYKEMRNNFEQKVQHEKQIKTLMKNLVNKNRQQDNIIQQYEGVLLKTRNELQVIMKEKQRLSKEVYTLRLQREDHSRKLSDEVTRLTHEKNFLQKKLLDAKQTITSLQYEGERLTNREKDYAQLEQRIEDMAVTIKSQEAMLDDKNETIQVLKDEVESIKGYEEKNKDELYELRKKYDKNKQKISSYENEISSILQENQQYVKTNEELEDKIRQQDEEKLKMEKEFDEFQEILQKQMKEKEERQKEIRQIVDLLEQCRAENLNKSQQVEQYKRQIQRCQIQIQDKQRRMKKQIYEVEEKYRNQLRKMQDEHEKTKKQAKQKLQRLTKDFLL